MKKSIFILFGLLAIMGCDENENIEPEKVESYPVSVGKEWVYNRELIMRINC